MSQKKVYVALQKFCETDDRPRKVLREAGFQVEENRWGRRLRREEMPELLREADAILAGVEPYDAKLLEALPKLQCISRCGVGTDSIDEVAARRLGVAILNTPEEVVEPVAELTVAMILALARHLPLHVADFQEGLWKKRTGFLLSEWTVGLVGFGRIGQAVECLLRPFGPRILVSDPRLEGQGLPETVTPCPLDTLLSQADCISLHLSRPAQEGPLIGPKELASMKRGSYLVNTARGFLVDEAALQEALLCGHLAGAALDVFETEPYSGPLASLPQVLCTPHIATLTRASRCAMELSSAQNVVQFFLETNTAATVGRKA